MGKPFEVELKALSENIAFALSHSVDELQNALNKAVATGRVFVCGAGGSFSAAVFTQLLLENARINSQTISPMHFLQMARPAKPASLILFSAAGKNKDVLRVIQRATLLGIAVVLICSTKGSPAAKLLRANTANAVFEFTYPELKDGFLAVNSLAVTWWLVARALGFSPPDAETVERLATTKHDVSFFESDRRHVCLLLHDLWTKPVAVDLESKMAEAALCCPLISDWRQFGHGRHNWLAKNASFSSVFSLRLAETMHVEAKTLGLIPKTIARSTLVTSTPGVAGVCELLIQSFAFVGALGKKVGIDPGRPGIPRFGSALYRLAMPSQRVVRKHASWDVVAAKRRKGDAMGLWQSSACEALVDSAAERYLDSLKKQKFGAVVLDFDGTVAASGIRPEEQLDPAMAKVICRLLSRKILVGIATGRGDSCHKNISGVVPEKLWGNLFISHYNGASVKSFDELMKGDNVWPDDRILREITDVLAADPLLKNLVSIHFKGVQITLRAKDGIGRQIVEQITRAVIASRYSKIVRLVASSHTLDIVPMGTTKRIMTDHLARMISQDLKVLAIGDRGDLCGNDFELLSHEYSLSVDCVSANIDTCWNYLPGGVSHQSGTIWYLQRARTGKGYFQLK